MNGKKSKGKKVLVITGTPKQKLLLKIEIIVSVCMLLAMFICMAMHAVAYAAR